MRKTTVIIVGAVILFLVYTLQAGLMKDQITLLGFAGFLIAGILYYLWTLRK